MIDNSPIDLNLTNSQKISKLLLKISSNLFYVKRCFFNVSCSHPNSLDCERFSSVCSTLCPVMAFTTCSFPYINE